jgi:hypothetical protein
MRRRKKEGMPPRDAGCSSSRSDLPLLGISVFVFQPMMGVRPSMAAGAFFPFDRDAGAAV